MKLKHVKYAIVLKDWELESAKEISQALKKYAIMRGVTEVLKYALENCEAIAYFPAEWGETDGIGNKAPEDPLTARLRRAEPRLASSFDKLQSSMRGTESL